MSKCFKLFERGRVVPVIVEPDAYVGVKKIAEKVTKDILAVSWGEPVIVENVEAAQVSAFDGRVILFATQGKSKLIDGLEAKGLLTGGAVTGMREVYETKIVAEPWPGISQALVIRGSDKRGTIYGMFELSKMIGVSPLHFWGDVTPEKKSEMSLDENAETISKEPSVKYRGFFINDEWPCFGNWTFEHFGGFTAEMYDHVFELLLRLKGNYLWPAMWNSAFAMDGPGLKNAELADMYGVIMGNSHHEPCLRAGVEYGKLRGSDSIYGDAWNYYVNKEGLLKFWEDGLKRNGKFENIITVGMRGENDSAILGKEATLKDNIELLKAIITEQKRLIRENVNEDLSQVSMMLALYKEVEPYFYGDENTEGLKGWDGLDGITLMFCEDNHGNMRTLPSEEIRSHEGGCGMYYHFDYHGDPVSYEWVNSTSLAKVWEQMTMAYEFGVKDLWIVNVGDLKFNEFPLCYFMELAYDFEKWGTTAPNKTKEFTYGWLTQQFGGRISEEQLHQLYEIQSSYTSINALRKPEALNSKVYHPANYCETDLMLQKSHTIIDLAERLYGEIAPECRDMYYSMIYFPAVASMNLLQMMLFAGKNEHYAKQGKPLANDFANKVTQCIVRDRELADEFGKFKGGKWNGMQLASHIGFTKWNDFNCRYPLRIQVEPADKPRMVVSRADAEKIAVKEYFGPMSLEVKDFLYPGNTVVDIEVANDGIGELTYSVEFVPHREWLSFRWETDTVKKQEILQLVCDREKLPAQAERCDVFIDDGDTRVVLEVYGRAVDDTCVPPMTFFENNGVVTINANHYSSLNNKPGSELILLEDYGRTGYGLKNIPVTATFTEGDVATATYLAHLEKTGEYIVELWLSPSNPLNRSSGLRYALSVNGGDFVTADSLPPGFAAGVSGNELWESGVLNQVRKSVCKVQLKQGVNEIEIGLLDSGMVLEHVQIYTIDNPPKQSYLGPAESYYKK